VGEARRRREDAEQRDADGDRLAPSDTVGDGAEEYGTKHHAEQRGTDHEARVLRRHAHVFHDRGQGDAGDGQVIAVADDDEGAPQQHPGVEAG